MTYMASICVGIFRAIKGAPLVLLRKNTGSNGSVLLILEVDFENGSTQQFSKLRENIRF